MSHSLLSKQYNVKVARVAGTDVCINHVLVVTKLDPKDTAQDNTSSKAFPCLGGFFVCFSVMKKLLKMGYWVTKNHSKFNIQSVQEK